MPLTNIHDEMCQKRTNTYSHKYSSITELSKHSKNHRYNQTVAFFCMDFHQSSKETLFHVLQPILILLHPFSFPLSIPFFRSSHVQHFSSSEKKNAKRHIISAIKVYSAVIEFLGIYALTANDDRHWPHTLNNVP